MVFEETILKKDGVRRFYSIDEISDMRNNNISEFIKIKDYLYCPECEKPRLTHNLCTERPSYFSTYVHEEHTMDCSLKNEKANSSLLSSLEDDESLDKLNNRLKSTLVSLFTDKKSKFNPLIIKTHSVTGDIVTSDFAGSTKNYYIPKKRITNGLSDDDIDTIKIFYGKVCLRCKQIGDSYRLFLINKTNNKSTLICSLYVSKNVYNHLDIQVNDYFECSIAFYSKISLNLKDNKKYYNSVLTDSRKIVWMKRQ